MLAQTRTESLSLLDWETKQRTRDRLKGGGYCVEARYVGYATILCCGCAARGGQRPAGQLHHTRLTCMMMMVANVPQLVIMKDSLSTQLSQAGHTRGQSLIFRAYPNPIPLPVSRFFLERASHVSSGTTLSCTLFDREAQYRIYQHIYHQESERVAWRR